MVIPSKRCMHLYCTAQKAMYSGIFDILIRSGMTEMVVVQVNRVSMIFRKIAPRLSDARSKPVEDTVCSAPARKSGLRHNDSASKFPASASAGYLFGLGCRFLLSCVTVCVVVCACARAPPLNNCIRTSVWSQAAAVVLGRDQAGFSSYAIRWLQLSTVARLLSNRYELVVPLLDNYNGSPQNYGSEDNCWSPRRK